MDAFHPVSRAWFERAIGAPTEAQARGWPHIVAGEHTLIAAPTGSGKTLAAFFAALDGLYRRSIAGELRDETEVLYVSPLKALSNDIQKNLALPLAGLAEAFRAAGHDPELVRSAVRTGDTAAKDRAAMHKVPPHIVVTTPESLYLLLGSPAGRSMLRTVRTVIVDEIHALAGDRRGAHLALSLERLAHLTGGPLQRVGLSATQKPIDEVARFLVGEGAPCAVVDASRARPVDLEIEVPRSPLEAVMAAEVWAEVYDRLAELVQAHATTLVFVNTRRLAERITRALAERLGEDAVTSHHGSLSTERRHWAEDRLKRGELRALVATASLEMGIDVGSVGLVCQVGTTRAISTLVQRVGRADHRAGGTPKGRIFPLTRDELVESVALSRAVDEGLLDALTVPAHPLDVLAQQIVATVADDPWDASELYELVTRAYPYRSLRRQSFDDVVAMLAHGFSTRRGRRGAHLHEDAVHGTIRGRRGARLTALTNAGAIPENADYRVELEPEGTLVGSLNEDFAIESMAGDIFQLGNTSWQIVRVLSGVVRVQDAKGKPPTIPFWLGEAPARTRELSELVSRLREEANAHFASGGDGSSLASRLSETPGVPRAAAEQVAAFLEATHRALAIIPTQRDIVLERFFDEAGGMQLVIHSPYGGRVNRAWGLALRKRFCRSFNFELQAAATEDAIILSLGETHSFALEEVGGYLSARSVRDVLVQALLDAPMFQTRWRWVANRALAVPRRRGGKRVPANIQRMQAEDLIAVAFPDQLACLENIQGDRQIPDHPLVTQTIDDCLVDAMDIEGLERLIGAIESGEVRCHARDLPEPSVAAAAILNSMPYTFLDDAPLEERRARAVYARRGLDPEAARSLGALDARAIEQVKLEAWPTATTPDEAHDALMQAGLVAAHEGDGIEPFFAELIAAGRATRVSFGAMSFVAATERVPEVSAALPEASVAPRVRVPERFAAREWSREDALREVVRSRLEVSAVTSCDALALLLGVHASTVEQALAALEGEGFALRGHFSPGVEGEEWCERRLLARIHRLTIHKLRAEIEPVSPADFFRFLLSWQRVAPADRVEGLEGVAHVLEMLDGFAAAAGAWEEAILPARVRGSSAPWLDDLCRSGRFAWGRMGSRLSSEGKSSGAGPLRQTPIAIVPREHAALWMDGTVDASAITMSGQAKAVLAALDRRGAQFFFELSRESGLLPVQVEGALGELASAGLVTSDSFSGLRTLLVPAAQRDRAARARGQRVATALERAGRFGLLVPRGSEGSTSSSPAAAEARAEAQARILLKRYGVLFRKLLEREDRAMPWRDLSRVLRRMEARGEIRGGRFVSTVSGEQFALPDAVAALRKSRRADPALLGDVVISAADPLNLVAVLLPGPKIAAIGAHRILIRDGTPVAVLEGEKVRPLAGERHDGERLSIRSFDAPSVAATP